MSVSAVLQSFGRELSVQVGRVASRRKRRRYYFKRTAPPLVLDQKPTGISALPIRTARAVPLLAGAICVRRDIVERRIRAHFLAGDDYRGECRRPSGSAWANHRRAGRAGKGRFVRRESQSELQPTWVAARAKVGRQPGSGSATKHGMSPRYA